MNFRTLQFELDRRTRAYLVSLPLGFGRGGHFMESEVCYYETSIVKILG